MKDKNKARKISLEIKDLLINLAIDDNLPLDMTCFDVGGIEKIILKHFKKNK